MDNPPASPSTEPVTLGSFPSEVLQQIFYFTTPTTFFQLIQVNRKFFGVASESRELILHHLRHVPGRKVGLDSQSISTGDLFLIFRQRAAANLYGANFTADCRNLEPSLRSQVIFDPRASCLTSDGDSCVVFRNSLRIKLNLHSNPLYGATIEGPYADGRARIIQAVQKTYHVSVLYAWEQPEKDPVEDISHPAPDIPSKQYVDWHRGAYDHRDGLRYRATRATPKTPALPAPRVRYHLLHYDLYRSDKPLFFHIPTHKSLSGLHLVPVHLAVHNRVQCAILWDLPDTIRPTSNATVCLYRGEHLPLNEPGNYNVWVIYPFDHPAPNHRPGIKVGDREITRDDSDSEDGAQDSRDRNLYTYTQNHQPTNDGGRTHDNDVDLRFLHHPLKPRSISFFKDGRLLSLYAPGSTIPFTTLLANDPIRARLYLSHVSPWGHSTGGTQWPRTICRRVSKMNYAWIHGHHFTLSTAFFSKHDQGVRSGPRLPDLDEFNLSIGSECVTNMLCLGSARIPSSNIPAAQGSLTGSGPEVLTIVQIRLRKHVNDCSHIDYRDNLPVGLPRPPREPRSRRNATEPNPAQELDISVVSATDLTADDGAGGNEVVEHSEQEEVHSDSDLNLDHGAADGTDVRVVARLWGWNAQATSLTGSETVKVSPMGERIAIAQWDKVLIYALNPEALCEKVWDDGNGGEDIDSDNRSHSSSHNDPSHDNDVIEDDEDSVANISESVYADEGLGVDGDEDLGNASEIPADPILLAQSADVPFSLLSANSSSLPAPASVISNKSTSSRNSGHYYPHVQDENLGGSIALLRPVVLKMDTGAVVRKMCWGTGRWRHIAEDQGDSNDEENEVEEPGPGEYGGHPTDEVTGHAKDKDRQAGGLQNTSNESSHPPASPRADGEGGPASTDLETGHPQDQPRVSSPSTPNLPINGSSNEHYADPNDQIPHSAAEQAVSAPFSDMKPDGQIQHINRPSEHDTDPDRPILTDSTLNTNQDTDQDSERQATPKDGAAQEESTVVTIPCLPVGAGSPVDSTSPTQRRRMRERERERKPRYRSAENELVVMTDRGIQIWDLSCWGRGLRLRDELLSSDGFLQ
ncbi:hypothetical protein G647_06389 [Cladophialophora carrionii CBS 160.54]|uniref:F-box domain-containing protein n=1 Tax=Cladophialophora carrionii CBS 160.54 TaxID=1279043 RepID=V9D608_9EURO|nr:uncharacterized protein G647_06389 [Cladophialophora carrionii CBS 160.54]ETI22315.1 hypothetical protein G647_06389 [Cladophialophora carrionii CBS 160.54]